MRSTRSIEILCLALAALVLIWSGALANQMWPVVGLLGVFALAIVGFRGRRFLPGRTRSKLLIESWSMVVFVTGVLWFTGKGESPLFNLYLLPIILSALTLGRVITLLQVAAVAVCHLLLAMTTPGVEVISLLYASQVVGQVAPFLLVAYLTTTLSADITEARERIENLAQTDSLTGLYNVRMFNEVWQREHDACEVKRGGYSLLMIDIDKLKEINDMFGLEAGNSAITLVAQCLQRSIRATDHAARLGGDEFAVLLPGASPEVAEAVIKRVRHNVYKTTLDLKSRMIRCSVSIGVVNYPKDARDMRDLRSLADDRMYRDKELRRSPGAEANA
ncbi:MAG TPA: GGDEF domain-containing protein [Steroidobacteraceae bacterium]|jgi:diguanylate cyclase (GGDEF)-like protein|nr:GGDEF domain-containing protein [Steroidobacteraceae bacterium]